jgi:photosystem II stability/assembly factor-like uncharacterized protein
LETTSRYFRGSLSPLKEPKKCIFLTGEGKKRGKQTLVIGDSIMIKRIGFSAFILVFCMGLHAQTWVAQTSPQPGAFRGVFAIDQNTAVAVGDGGLIIKTVDGGATWTELTSGTIQSLFSVCFTSAANGWAVGQRIILRTVNGGTTWSKYAVGASYEMSSVIFGDHNNGWMVGGTDILKTTNGGVIWDAQSSGTTNYLRGVFAMDANNAWAVGSGGTVIRTTDGGADWNFYSSGDMDFLASIHFADANNGLAVGQQLSESRQVILKTTDGGATWNRSLMETTDNIYVVYMINANTAWAAGTGGLILKSLNGGVTWTEDSSGTTSTLYNIHFADASVGWIVGTQGTILKTTSGSSFLNRPRNNRGRVAPDGVSGHLSFGIAGRGEILSLDVSSIAKAEILDLSGKLLNTISISSLDVVWDGINSQGKTVPGGACIIKLTGSNAPLYKRVVIP